MKSLNYSEEGWAFSKTMTHPAGERIKMIREMTGHSFFDCKKAYANCKGDVDAALRVLRSLEDTPGKWTHDRALSVVQAVT